jgi:spore germination protein YaaH
LRSILVTMLASMLGAASVHAQSPGGTASAQGAVPQARARALAPTEVFGYLPSWELADAAAIDLERLTTLAWFGLEAHPDGHLIRTTEGGAPTPGWSGWTGQAFTDLLARAHRSGVRVVLTVERFAWDRAGARRTIALLEDRKARAALVADIVATITERDVDGVSLDFEPLPKAVRTQFTALVRELRAAMNVVDRRLQLTVAVTPDAAGYDVRALTAADAADAAILMGYEFHTASSRVAGSVDPLGDPDGFDLRESVSAVLARTPATRVILALPWYGRAWSTKGSRPGSATRSGGTILSSSTATYEEAVARATRSGRRYDRTAASAWSAYRASACATCAVTWRQLWYDDVDAVRAKVGFALRKGLRGVGLWALGYQGGQPELWSALRLAVEGMKDAKAPSGTATLDPASALGVRDGLPLVGDVVALDLVAADGPSGSGVAFVRIATDGRLARDGALVSGVTFPAADTVRISMPDAGPVDEVFIPGGGASSAVPSPSTSQGPRPSATSGPRKIWVQWRDVAGTWSRPIVLRVFHQAGASGRS